MLWLSVCGLDPRCIRIFVPAINFSSYSKNNEKKVYCLTCCHAHAAVATTTTPVLHPAPPHQLLNQRLHVDVEPLGGPKVRVAARLVQDNLGDALLYQLVVGGSRLRVIAYAHQMLQH